MVPAGPKYLFVLGVAKENSENIPGAGIYRIEVVKRITPSTANTVPAYKCPRPKSWRLSARTLRTRMAGAPALPGLLVMNLKLMNTAPGI